jgi:hypothetical protein
MSANQPCARKIRISPVDMVHIDLLASTVRSGNDGVRQIVAQPDGPHPERRDRADSPRTCMVRNLVVQIELAGPAVSKVQRHFLAQPALMTNAMSI